MQSYAAYLEARELRGIAVALVDGGVDVQRFCEAVGHAARKSKYLRMDPRRSLLYIANEAERHVGGLLNELEDPGLDFASAGPVGASAQRQIDKGKRKPWYSRLASAVGGMLPGATARKLAAHRERAHATNRDAYLSQIPADPAQPAPVPRPAAAPSRNGSPGGGGGGLSARAGEFGPNSDPMAVTRGGSYGRRAAGNTQSITARYNAAISHLENLQQMLEQIPGPTGRPLRISNLQAATNFVRQARAAFQQNPDGIMQAFKTGKPLPGGGGGGGVNDPKDPRSPLMGNGGGPATAAATPAAADPRSAREKYEQKMRGMHSPEQLKQVMAAYDANNQAGAVAQQQAARGQSLGFGTPDEYKDFLNTAGQGDAAAGQKRLDGALAAAQQAGIPQDKAMALIRNVGMNQDWAAVAAQYGFGKKTA